MIKITKLLEMTTMRPGKYIFKESSNNRVCIHCRVTFHLKKCRIEKLNLTKFCESYEENLSPLKLCLLCVMSLQKKLTFSKKRLKNQIL